MYDRRYQSPTTDTTYRMWTGETQVKGWRRNGSGHTWYSRRKTEDQPTPVIPVPVLWFPVSSYSDPTTKRSREGRHVGLRPTQGVGFLCLGHFWRVRHGNRGDLRSLRREGRGQIRIPIIVSLWVTLKGCKTGVDTFTVKITYEEV